MRGRHAHSLDTIQGDGRKSSNTPSGGAEPGWMLVEEGLDPTREREIESLFTVANGYLGTRGSLQEGGAHSEPATFVAGVFSEPTNGVRELVIAPDWAQLRVRVEGEALRPDVGETLEHRRTLDMLRGVLEREWRHCDRAGRITRLRFVRFASLADRHALVEWVTVTPENYSAQVAVESVVDGDVSNPPDTRYLQPVLIAPSQPGAPAVVPRLLVVRTLRSDLVLAWAATSVLEPQPVSAEYGDLGGEAWIGASWSWKAQLGLTYRVCKLVAVYTSRDGPEPALLAEEHASRLRALGADALLEAHAETWRARWAAADVEIAGDEADQRATRFALYHLISAANPEDERVSIGARTLTGDSYKGHVFWDTEIYMLPFYVFTHPPSARALLMYRYHTLPGARRKARAMGYQGALYPWESTDTGEETTPKLVIAPDGEVIPILTGEQQQHISADVAYAVWQYWHATGDDRFFLEAGAEMVLETARFWASRVHLEDDGRYHIRQVIGPDEYHVGVDDNAFTNGMAQWNLERGAEVARLLQERWPERWQALADRLALSAEEATAWLAIAQAMYTGLDPRTGLLEQFRGYFDLEYVDLAAYEPRTASMQVLLGWREIARTQIVKQPDVVMLIYLLWDRFPARVREANFRFYEPRCDHGSSLSPSIHALVAARLGDLDLAGRYFRQAAEIDLANNMGNSAGGVHAAAQGGLWQALTFGFAGMEPHEDGLSFAPHLLPRWQTLTFPLRWRERQVKVVARAAPPALEVEVERGEPMLVMAGGTDGERVLADVGKRYRTRPARGVWQGWREVSP